jgi:outer membrane protein assembly factor BamB
MQHCSRFAIAMLFLFIVSTARGDDWRQFRGPDGLGISNEKNLPSEWSAKKNIVWKIKLPGAGAASPITLGNRIFVVCYSGYGMDNKDPGEMKDLRRHLLCLDRKDGSTMWAKEFEPQLPEHKYAGEGAYHGYAPSTPVTDGERLYVFFGKSGVYCFDLDGKQLWHATVGKGTNGWGSGPSPVLYKNLVIINASVESGSMYAFDKLSGKEVWKAPKMSSAWNTPLLVPTSPPPSPPLDKGGMGGVELVVSVQARVLAFDPDTGKELWNADGVHRYVCPSVVANNGVVYAIGGGHTSLAVKAGGRGDVTKTHELWREKKGSNVGSPLYYEGHLYWAGDGSGIVHCQEAATGKFVYSERLTPASQLIYASPLLADGKIYYTSQKNGTYVVAAQPKFKQLAHNIFEDDKHRGNASIAVSNGQLLLRNDQYLYCIGNR